MVHKKAEVESSSTTMENLIETVVELTENIAQLSTMIAQLQETLFKDGYRNNKFGK